MSRSIIVTLVFLIMAGFVFGGIEEHLSSAKFGSAGGKRVSGHYNRAVEAAWAKFQEELEEAQKKYVGDLKRVKRLVVADENYKEAAIIKKEIERFRIKDLNEGLVLYMSFDKVTGKQVTDQSGKGNHGILKGGQIVPGKIGNALECSAKNKIDGVLVKDDNSLDLKQVTATAWIKTDNLDKNWNRVLDKDYKTGYTITLGGDHKGKQYRNKVFFEAAHNSVETMGLEIDVVDGKWHFLAGSYDGRVFKLYVDGKLVKTKERKNPKQIPNNDYDLMIGNTVVPYDPPEENYFDGLIDEVRLYERVLSDKDVGKLYRMK